MALTLVACTPDQENDTMTPEQSRQKLISEIITVIQAMAPGARVDSSVEDRDLPCGGLAGAEYTSVHSYVVVTGSAGIGGTETDVMAKTRTPLEQKGWKITRNRKSGETSRFSVDKPGTGSGVLLVSPEDIVFNGETLCVDNPDR
ncbi:hypothetical protein [Nonomuraea sp. NPDC050691]|uniref:hypothetical protein n=1 Tax=Nonomuraea sp. NPDC050691 TaxID=3155661 RepID=UPI0034026F1A